MVIRKYGILINNIINRDYFHIMQYVIIIGGNKPWLKTEWLKKSQEFLLDEYGEKPLPLPLPLSPKLEAINAKKSYITTNFNTCILTHNHTSSCSSMMSSKWAWYTWAYTLNSRFRMVLAIVRKFFGNETPE